MIFTVLFYVFVLGTMAYALSVQFWPGVIILFFLGISYPLYLIVNYLDYFSNRGE